MNALSSATSATAIAVVDPHEIRELPVLVILPHNRCNCHCVMCDIWRIKETREVTAADLAPHLDAMRALGVRHIALSGGEPQLHSDLPLLLALLRNEGIRITLLTAGLLLESGAEAIVHAVDDVIISLDGPPAIHDQIRRVPKAFATLQRGVERLRSLRPGLPISMRSTVQKQNFGFMAQTIETARGLGVDSISFLAADMTSEAFNRPNGWETERQAKVALTAADVDLLQEEIERLIVDYQGEIAKRFITESPEKLRRIVRHFRAQLGAVTPQAPMCNAPWVSAVIEADGSVRPCFFHPKVGNIHDNGLLQILNGPQALEFRRNLDIESNTTCQRCVCSLHLPRT